MPHTTILSNWQKAHQNGEKQLAVLLDPDKFRPESCLNIIMLAHKVGVGCFFVGGSLLSADLLGQLLTFLKKHDGLLLLSLISGRNPDLLIGQHVLAAPMLRQSGLQIMPTGYILIEGGHVSSVQYISHTNPIPAHKPDIAAATAMAGEMLGLQLIYLEAGSGAKSPVEAATIAAVRKSISLPLIVGGGIRTPESAARAAKAGADIIVIGTAFEQDPTLLYQIANSIL
jgi:phosphoglycerol geranylgeranyltransferase